MAIDVSWENGDLPCPLCKAYEAEEALVNLKEVCGMNCERLPAEVREALHKIPGVGKEHGCEMGEAMARVAPSELSPRIRYDPEPVSLSDILHARARPCFTCGDMIDEATLTNGQMVTLDRDRVRHKLRCKRP